MERGPRTPNSAGSPEWDGQSSTGARREREEPRSVEWRYGGIGNGGVRSTGAGPDPLSGPGSPQEGPEVTLGPYSPKSTQMVPQRVSAWPEVIPGALRGHRCGLKSSQSPEFK